MINIVDNSPNENENENENESINISNLLSLIDEDIDLFFRRLNDANER